MPTHSSHQQNDQKPPSRLRYALLLILCFCIWVLFVRLRSPQSTEVVITFEQPLPAPQTPMKPAGAWAMYGATSGQTLCSTSKGGAVDHLLWEKEMPLPQVESPIIGQEGRILVSVKGQNSQREPQRFVALDGAGNLLWSYNLEPFSASACWLQDRGVVVSGFNQLKNTEAYHRVVRLNSEGKVIWRWTAKTTHSSGQSLLNLTDKGQLLLGIDGSTYSWNERGQVLWNTPPPVKPQLTNLASHDGEYFFGCCISSNYGSALYALDREGKLLWVRNYKRLLSQVAVGADGLLNVAESVSHNGENYRILCLNTKGEEVWSSQPLRPYLGPLSAHWVGIALSPEGKTVACNGNGIVCLNKRGEVLWEEVRALGADPRAVYASSSQILLSSDGFCYVNPGDKRGLLILSPKGQVIDRVELKDSHITGMALGEKRLYLTATKFEGNHAKGVVLAYELNPKL